MQDINKKRVVLEEVISLKAAAITDPKIRKMFAVVGCGGAERTGVTQMWGQSVQCIIIL